VLLGYCVAVQLPDLVGPAMEIRDRGRRRRPSSQPGSSKCAGGRARPRVTVRPFRDRSIRTLSSRWRWTPTQLLRLR